MTWAVYYTYLENFHWNSFLNVIHISQSKSQIVEPNANLIAMANLPWDHALSLLSLYVSHGKEFFFSLSSRPLLKKKKHAWSQVMANLAAREIKVVLNRKCTHKSLIWVRYKRQTSAVWARIIVLRLSLKLEVDNCRDLLYQYLPTFSARSLKLKTFSTMKHLSVFCSMCSCLQKLF